ncbi:MAG: DUF4403 family protein [Gemmatimonadaceae bacterium]
MLLRPCLVLIALSPLACGNRFEVPRPGDATRGTPLPPAEPARITLPVTVALAAIRARLDSQFPQVDSLGRAQCLSLGGAICHQYVYRRAALDLSMSGNRISLVTDLRYRARVALPGVGGIGSCGYGADRMKRAQLRLVSELYWRVDWSVGSRQTMLDANLLDPCRATVFNIDASPLMRRILGAQLERLRQAIDSIIPAVVTVKPAADSLWRTLQEPVQLDSGVWLILSPDAARLSPLTGSGGAVRTTVTLIAHPRVVVGSRPALETSPLPSLALADASPGIHVPIDIEIPFADIERRATAQLAGETAGKEARVQRVKVWSAGDTAVVQVDLFGKVAGSLYLVGRVAYDPASRILSIADLRYTVQSRDVMSRIRVTLGASRIKGAVDNATSGGHWNAGTLLDRARDRLTQELNRSLARGTRISGAITSVRVGALYTTSSSFVLRVVLDGDAQLYMQ